jgi:anti-anti-sigma regulatory factor
MQKAVILIFPSPATPGKVLVQLEGTLDINQVGYLKTKFESILDEWNEIEIKGENIHYLDLTFIQLFESFKKTAREKSKKLKWFITIEDDIALLLKRAGIEINNINSENNVESSTGC